MDSGWNGLTEARQRSLEDETRERVNPLFPSIKRTDSCPFRHLIAPLKGHSAESTYSIMSLPIHDRPNPYDAMHSSYCEAFACKHPLNKQ